MTTFFISDTHFGHKNIIDYCKRPFTSVEEMNEHMVQLWNEEVKTNDIVYHLHGHAHGTAGVKHNRLDVGVDASKVMAPMHIDDVMQRMQVNNLWAQEMNK